MKILKTIFGGGAEKLVESVGGVLDNLSTSKEVKLEDINSVQDVASNMKEVIKEEKDSPHKKNTTNG